MSYPLEKIILFEVDKPIELNKLLSYYPGIWFWTIVNEVETVTDDHGVTGYYQYQNAVKYNIKSLLVNNEPYSIVNTLEECLITNKSFFYESPTYRLYIHFDETDHPLDKDLFFGAANGYSKLPSNEVKPYYGGNYYPPLLKNVPNIKKSIDKLFFGLLKYVKASVTLINSNGEFDDWRDQDLFGQPSRILVGNIDDNYTDFQSVFEGFVSDDSRTFDEFKIKIEDPRRALSQPVATNKLNQTDWPDLKDTNVNKVKPVAYGKIYNAEAICLNEEDASAADRIFLICDTEFNIVDSLDTIYVEGVETALTGSTDLTAGTFTMTKASVFDAFDAVTIDFTITPSYDGIDIILDLMLNYNDYPFIDSLWDTAEVNAASSRTTSLYIDKGKSELSKEIESVCVDIDARFFMKNNGLYTIRIYDEDRTPNTREIPDIEWMNFPSIDNNGSEFLSSVIISYNKNEKNGTWTLYENTDFIDEVFDRYKKKKVGEYNTNLTSLTDAQDKSDTIMNISKNVQDVIERKCNWNNFGIEPTDFVVCSPLNRPSEESVRGVYEVLKVTSNLKDFNIGLSLRYVKEADDLPIYLTIDDDDDLAIDDNNDLALIGKV